MASSSSAQASKRKRPTVDTATAPNDAVQSPPSDASSSDDGDNTAGPSRNLRNGTGPNPKRQRANSGKAAAPPGDDVAETGESTEVV
jgi:hypothetical protein